MNLSTQNRDAVERTLWRCCDRRTGVTKPG